MNDPERSKDRLKNEINRSINEKMSFNTTMEMFFANLSGGEMILFRSKANNFL